jgi:murein DD-endopeptidase MepM/ murein hydrolase activator NlpD
MPTWPLPECPDRRIPVPGEAGSFWEDRGDRYHCGIDLYAPAGSRVAAIFAGMVLGTGMQTSPATVSYWNRTFYVLVKGNNGQIIRYAELGSLMVREGDHIKEGQCIGTVGAVIDPSRIDRQAPAYIHRLGAAAITSMLHLEVYTTLPGHCDRYLGGNWFGCENPSFLVDPAELLRKAGGR